MNRLTYFYFFLFLLLLQFPVFPFKYGSSDPDVKEWSKIIILEAFISKKTTDSNRDFFSEPEFGWQAIYRNKIFTREELYSEFYVPVPLKKKLELCLVERDINNDDVITSFYIGAGKKKYIINNNGDFAVINRISIYPDANSGGDNNPKKSKKLQSEKIVSGSVSFQKKDHTDYFKAFGKNISAAVICETADCIIDSPGGAKEKIYYIEGLGNHFTILENTDKNPLIRIRSPVMADTCPYHIIYIKNKNKKAKIRNFFLNYLVNNFQKCNYHYYSELADLMAVYDDSGTKSFCRKKSNLSQTAIKAACAFFLYKFGNRKDKNELEKKYKKESSAYKELVDSARGYFIK
jgi:hypothetical protein